MHDMVLAKEYNCNGEYDCILYSWPELWINVLPLVHNY